VTDLAALEIERLQGMFNAAFGGDAVAEGTWIPAVDIYETAGKDVVVKVDLPEMKREDIKVTFENNLLVIEGARKAEAGRDGYHRIERGFGAFRRSFSMPSTVDASQIQASYQDGVLTVTLPRREEAKARQIQING
jgi:HSP20 family protein